jgi:hypothetical protein
MSRLSTSDAHPIRLLVVCTLALTSLLVWSAGPRAQAPCGGVERWAVKVGADADAPNIG